MKKFILTLTLLSGLSALADNNSLDIEYKDRLSNLTSETKMSKEDEVKHKFNQLQNILERAIKHDLDTNNVSIRLNQSKISENGTHFKSLKVLYSLSNGEVCSGTYYVLEGRDINVSNYLTCINEGSDSIRRIETGIN